MSADTLAARIRERAFEFAKSEGFSRPINKELTDALVKFALSELSAAEQAARKEE